MAQNDHLIGKTLGKYTVLESIGRGGMGKVYLANHIHTGRQVAIKTLSANVLEEYEPKQQMELIERFYREALAIAQIRHPNIVEIYDFDNIQSDLPAYIVMPYLGKLSLRRLLSANTPLQLEKTIELMIQISGGVGAAHKEGIIHRDLKPSNIMIVTDGNDTEKAVILDFGVAKLLNSELTKITRFGQPGTTEYMSPEQCRDEELDARSDVYNLGLIFYEMLCGKKTFSANSDAGWITCHVSKHPDPLPDNLPDKLTGIITQCLEKNADQRFPDASRLQENLIQFKIDEQKRKSEKEQQNLIIRLQKQFDERELKIREEEREKASTIQKLELDKNKNTEGLQENTAQNILSREAALNHTNLILEKIRKEIHSHLTGIKTVGSNIGLNKEESQLIDKEVNRIVRGFRLDIEDESVRTTLVGALTVVGMAPGTYLLITHDFQNWQGFLLKYCLIFVGGLTIWFIFDRIFSKDWRRDPDFGIAIAPTGSIGIILLLSFLVSIITGVIGLIIGYLMADLATGIVYGVLAGPFLIFIISLLAAKGRLIFE